VDSNKLPVRWRVSQAPLAPRPALPARVASARAVPLSPVVPGVAFVVAARRGSPSLPWCWPMGERENRHRTRRKRGQADRPSRKRRGEGGRPGRRTGALAGTLGPGNGAERGGQGAGHAQFSPGGVTPRRGTELAEHRSMESYRLPPTGTYGMQIKAPRRTARWTVSDWISRGCGRVLRPQPTPFQPRWETAGDLQRPLGRHNRWFLWTT
jgi:hypothetical protein